MIIQATSQVLLTIPPAAKVLGVATSVYLALQAAKKIPGLTKYLTGWVAIAVNVLMTATGLLLTIPADQLYTENTAMLLITTILGAAGIHGTVSKMSEPTVLATIPPSTQVKEVPATLVPDNPAAVAVDPKAGSAPAHPNFPPA